MPLDPNLIALYSQSLTNMGNMVTRANERAQQARAENGFLEGAFATMVQQRQSMGSPIDPKLIEKFSTGGLGQKRGIVTQLGTELELQKFQSQIATQQDSRGLAQWVARYQADPEADPAMNRNAFRLHVSEGMQMFPSADPNAAIGFINAMAPERPAPTRTTRINPDGTVELIEGATTATQTRAQERVMNLEEGMFMLDSLDPYLTDENLGLSGNIREFVGRVGPQLGIKVDQSAREGRTVLRSTIQSLLRNMSPDERFTKEDMQRIESIMASTGVFESADSARAAMGQVKRLIGGRILLNKMVTGDSIRPELLSDQEIIQAVSMGVTPAGVQLPANTDEERDKVAGLWRKWLEEQANARKD